MPTWSPRSHHVERLHQAANAAAPAPGAVDDWMRHFGAPVPAPVVATPIHNWRQNFAPGDFLPFNYDVEAHLRRMGLGANRGAAHQSARPVANPVPVVAPVLLAPFPVVNPLCGAPLGAPPAAPPAAAGHGTLGMDEFLRLYPHLGVRTASALPVFVHPVGHSLHTMTLLSQDHHNLPRELVFL